MIRTKITFLLAGLAIFISACSAQQAPQKPLANTSQDQNSFDPSTADSSAFQDATLDAAEATNVDAGVLKQQIEERTAAEDSGASEEEIAQMTEEFLEQVPDNESLTNVDAATYNNQLQASVAQFIGGLGMTMEQARIEEFGNAMGKNIEAVQSGNPFAILKAQDSLQSILNQSTEPPEQNNCSDLSLALETATDVAFVVKLITIHCPELLALTAMAAIAMDINVALGCPLEGGAMNSMDELMANARAAFKANGADSP